jgi:hypothetical protein
MGEERHCISCNDILEGRVDKIYCNEYCKSAHHYQKKKEGKVSLFKKIDRQLKLNRRLLDHYNKSGKSTVRQEELIKAGFDPKYFTHYWKNKEKQVYLFCYEYGFLKLSETGKTKYLLVKWQGYMEEESTGPHAKA